MRSRPPEARVSALDWPALAATLDADGCATTGAILDARQCRDLASLYDDDGRFRSRVVMARHGFGRGEYKYLAYPLPPVVAALRQALYAGLAPIANSWARRLGLAADYPATLDAYLARCHAAGQTRPTPLLLRYGAGDYNCLHRDLYGPLVFPIQATILLSRPGADFAGGEFLLVEQRPRQQSVGRVVPLAQGEAVLFAVRDRPRAGARGFHRAAMRHGVSLITSGRRMTLGLIFHDAC
jgi:uncharacterized protein